MKTTRVTVLLALGLSSAGCGAESGDTTSASDTDTETSAYEREAMALKETDVIGYDAALANLRHEYGILTQELAGQELTDLPTKELAQRANGPAVETRSTDGLVADLQGTPVKRVYSETVHLSAGETLSWYTSDGTASVDPVLVLFQYEDGNFKTSGYLPPSANPKLNILSFSDDASGLHPRIDYTAPSTGYYVVMLHAYSYGSNGTATLNQAGCEPAPPPVCSGNLCLTQPPGPCFTATTPSTRVVGYTLRGTDAHYMYTENSLEDADPWLFGFDVSSGVGSANDDSNGRDSRIDHSDFRLSSSSANSYLLVGGYADGGSTRVKAWYRFD